MNRQQIFDKAARHLLTQNSRSVIEYTGGRDTGRCVYRHPDGRQCAAGPFIPDDVALANQNSRIDFIVGPEFDDDGKQLLRDLQIIHDVGLLRSAPHMDLGPIPGPDSSRDRAIVESWPTLLRQLAEREGLSSAVVDELRPKAG